MVETVRQSKSGEKLGVSTLRESILIIEDEPDIRELMEYNLVREGYRVLQADDGEEGMALCKEKAPDLVILDLMLPGVDGIEICRRFKSDPVTQSIPVIMVTAKSEEADVVLGLSMGADDYVTKPFGPKALVARVRAVLRRGPLKEDRKGGDRVVRAGVVIDRSRHEVTIDDEPITFTPTELRLLHFLASHPGRVFTRDHLLSRAIGEHAVVIDRNIDVHIRSIRQKLGLKYRALVETVRGVGYKFKDLAKR